jgi:hypothetical protein
MLCDIERIVVHPNWAATAERHTDQALPQSRHCRDSLGDQPSNVDDLKTGGFFESKDHSDLLTERSGIHCQECQVRRTGSIDHRHTTCARQHSLRD